MRMNSRLFRAVLFCLVGVSVQHWSAAQSDASSWDGLPEETVVAMRIPGGQAFVDAIRKTKFGAVMLSEKRKAGVIKALESDDSGEWSKIQQQLKNYELTTDDLFGLLAGESGYAIVMSVDDDQEPAVAGLGWLEPGEELASKFYEVIGRVIDEQDEERPIQRVDLTLADQPVMQLTLPTVNFEYDDEYDLPDDYSDLSEEEQGELLEIARQKWKDSAVETVVYRTILVSVLGDRLLVAHNFQEEAVDAAEATAEHLTAVFGRWIEAHTTGNESFATRLTAEPGAASVMALEGLPVFELLGDVAPFVKLLRSSAPSGEKAEQVVRIMGLDGLGAFAMRSTVEGPLWRSQFSLAAPAPRQGLMQLLDQELLAADPPQWVPASAVRYYQLSFDLGEAYEIIKAEVTREFPEQAAIGFATAETQVQNFLQVSLSEMLSSLGNRHVVMSFGMDEDMATEDNKNGSERMAVVWQVKDEQLWAKLLKAIAPFAGMAPGVESTEEQGFSGWRMKKGPLEGGLFLGKGYLVLGVGSGVVESVLSSLNNPPAGSDSLRGSKVFATASTMIDLERAVAVEVTDGNRYMSMMFRALNTQLTQFASILERANTEDEDNGSQVLMPLLRAILPSQEETEGMMGVAVGRWEVNDDGVFAESAQEMPAP